MKHLTLITMAALLATPAFEAEAVGNDGTRQGGEIMFIDGKPRLRDLVEPVCEDKTGAELMIENPDIGRALDAIAKLDWYFAAGLRREVSLLQICFTNDDLVRLKTRDWDSPIKPSKNPTAQGAVRTRGTYLVDITNKYFRVVPKEDQTFFPMHEAVHSFIPANVSRRKEGVERVIRTLSEVANGTIKNARKMHEAFAKSSVNYPRASRQLAPYRSAIEFALAPVADKRKMILASRDLNSLFNMNLEEVAKYAYAEHMPTLNLGAAAHVSAVLDQEDDVDFTVLDRVVNQPSGSSRIQAFDPVIVALSIPSVMDSPKYLQHVLESRAMGDGFVFYQKLKEKNLRIAYSRIVGNSSFAILGQGGQIPDPRYGDVFALSLTPYTPDSAAALQTELKGFIQFAAALARSGESGWKVLNATIANNDQFYAAFEVGALQTQLAKLNPPVAREKAHLAAALPGLVNGLRTTLYESMKTSVNEQSAMRLDQAIDWNRLGFKN